MNNKLISSNFAIDYCIFIQDVGSRGLLEFYYYEKDDINKEIIAAQYFGKISNLKHITHKTGQDCFIFTENTFYNFVNKFIECLDNITYPKNSYISQKDTVNSPVIHVAKLSPNNYAISRANTFDDAIDKTYSWTISLNDYQAQKLAKDLLNMKNLILKKK